MDVTFVSSLPAMRGSIEEADPWVYPEVACSRNRTAFIAFGTHTTQKLREWLEKRNGQSSDPSTTADWPQTVSQGAHFLTLCTIGFSLPFNVKWKCAFFWAFVHSSGIEDSKQFTWHINVFWIAWNSLTNNVTPLIGTNRSTLLLTRRFNS